MIIVLDVETQELIQGDVGNLRISIAGVRSGETSQIFEEHEITKIFPLLDNAELIVGHNLLGFDYKVLQKYAEFDVMQRYKAKTFDILVILMRKTDRAISLNDIAKRTLGIEKSGSGRDAPRLFQEGKIDELESYLLQDLAITHALFEHIREHGTLTYGHIFYKEPVQRKVAISITER